MCAVCVSMYERERKREREGSEAIPFYYLLQCLHIYFRVTAPVLSLHIRYSIKVNRDYVCWHFILNHFRLVIWDSTKSFVRDGYDMSALSPSFTVEYFGKQHTLTHTHTTAM